MNRLVGLILLLSHGVLSLLGHAGLHALASSATGCCSVQAEASDSTATASHRCCHHGCSHDTGDQKTGGQKTGGSNSEHQHSPAHDSRNCRLCEWFHNAHAPGLPQIELIVVDSIPTEITVFSESCLEQPVFSELSRGPPQVG